MSRILPIEIKEFIASTLNGTAQNFGTSLLNPAIKINIFNTSNVDCYIDYDGNVNVRMRIPAGGVLTLDESTLYFHGIDQEYYLPRGAQLTVTQVTAPASSGNIIAHVVTRMLP